MSRSGGKQESKHSKKVFGWLYRSAVIPLTQNARWVALGIKPSVKIRQEAYRLFKDEYESKNYHVVTVPGETKGRENYHTTLVYGFEADLFPDAAKMVQDAKLDDSDLLGYGDVECWSTRTPNTRVVVCTLQVSQKVIDLQKRIAILIPSTTADRAFKPHVSLLWLEQHQQQPQK